MLIMHLVSTEKYSRVFLDLFQHSSCIFPIIVFSMIVQIICPIHLITVTWTYFSSFSPLYVTLTFLVLYQSVPLLLFIVKDNDSVCFCLAISCSEFQQLLPTFTHISFALRTPKPTFNQVHSNGGFTLRSPHCGCLNTMYWRFSDSCLYYYERQRKSGDREAGCMPSGPALSWEKLTDVNCAVL